MATKWLSLFLATTQICHGYVDFGDLTRMKLEPTVSVPRPRHALENWQVRFNAPQHPMITAIAPFLTVHENGTHVIAWSTTYHQYSRVFQNGKGVFKRQNGVFQSDATLLATCTNCVGSSASTVCYPITTTGVIGGPVPPLEDTYCYVGAFIPVKTSTGLPCCNVCTPVANSTVIYTTGPFVPLPNTTTTTTITKTTETVTETSGSGGVTTTTITSGTQTITAIPGSSPTTGADIISSTTILPVTNTTTIEPVTRLISGTAEGCGTASGTGTVIGSGTVYIGPGGLIPVRSSGIVSGFASKVIGCGTIIATRGVFSGTANITGCGTGTGCAVMTGSGTVYPDKLFGLIGITSSGVASGCGRVVGCGILYGTGTFSIDAPITTTITPTAPPAAITTVNVYVSYCPPNKDPFHMAGNFTDLTSPPSSLTILPNSSDSDEYWPTNNLTSPSNSTLTNSTNSSNSTNDNPLCRHCASDTVYCCPWTVACGADGHCPYIALQRCGYFRFGANVVESANSSDRIGMERVEGARAPGLPDARGKGFRNDGGGGSDGNLKGVVRRGGGLGHGLGHGHWGGRRGGL